MSDKDKTSANDWKETIKQMISLQAGREERLAIADSVINNNGSIKELTECVLKNYQALIANK